MNKIQFLVLATLLLINISTLKLDPLQHQQALTNSAEYVQGLRDQQKRFEQSINNLDLNVQKTISTTTSQTDIDKKISILEEGILNQQNLIFNSSTTLIPVLVIKDQCVGLTEADKTRILQRCDTAISRIQQLQQKLSTMPEDLRVRELKLNAEHQIQYLTSLKNVVQNNCTTSVILSPTVYQSNLIADNWIAGQKGVSGITNEYIQRSLTNTNITNCPIDSPFLINGKCGNCQQGQVYDMSASACTTCPANTAFDSTSKTCKAVTPVEPPVPIPPVPTPPVPTPPVPTPVEPPAPNATNTQSLGTTVGTKPEATTYDIQCKSQTPYYNKDTKKCQACGPGQYYYFDQNACLKPNSNNPDSATQAIGNPAPLTAPVKVPCPASHPYFFDNSCHACVEPKYYFNQEDGKCYPCRPGQILTASNTCADKSTINLAEAQKRNNYIGELPAPTPGLPICPESTPYVSSQGLCINCPGQNPKYVYYVVSEKVCAACPDNTVYSEKERTCVQMSPTGTNIQGLTNQNYIGTAPTQQSAQPCDPSVPFYDVQLKGCTDCSKDPAKPIFDFNKQTCSACPEGENYDGTLHKCVATNVDAVKDQKYLGELTSTTQPSNPCPAEQPFYSTVYKKCVACPTTQNPSAVIFDLQKSQCVPCPQNQYYEKTLHKCVSTNSAAAGNAVYNGPIPVSTTNTCPQNKPFYSTKLSQCISCPREGQDPQNFVFDFNQGDCTSCANGDQFDTVLKKCVSTNTEAAATKPYIGNLPTTTSKNLCPTETPFYSTVEKKCISCPPASDSNLVYFDVKASDCVACATYNQKTRQCKVSYVSYISAPNWYSEHPFKTQQQALKKIQNGFVPCSKTTPFYNGVKCINCVEPTPYFNFDTNVCTACPSGTTFSGIANRCVNNNVDAKTLVPSVTDRIVTDEPISQVLDQYNKSPAAPCPAATPFFNGIKCINCVAPYQYFDMTKLDCVYCLQNSTYVNHQCQLNTGTGIAPSLESLIQNVFPNHKNFNGEVPNSKQI